MEKENSINTNTNTKEEILNKSLNSTIIYYSSTEAMDFFEYISNNYQDGIREFLNKNPKEKIWKYIEDNQYTILHRLAFQQVTKENENFFPIIYPILHNIKKNIDIETNKEEYEEFLNAKTEKGYTAMHYAAFRGNAFLISVLKNEGASISETNKQGLNILHLSAQGNQPTTLTYIKEKYPQDFDLNGLDNEGSTPLHWACFSGSETTVTYLLSWNVDVNKQDHKMLTPLHLAVINERKKIVQKLLQKGANKNLKDSTQRTPYDLAVKSKNKALMEMLKQNTSCNCCVVKAPMQKVEKNVGNIVIYFLCMLFNILCSFGFSLNTIYCKKDDKNFHKNKTYTFIYIGLTCLSLLIYVILLFYNISFSPSNEKFLDLIENKINVKKNENLSNYCPTCKILKKKNMIHCFICDKCTPDFDHHCYWINKDVGKKNYPVFLLFIICMVADLGFNAVINLANIIRYLKNKKGINCEDVYEIVIVCKDFFKNAKLYYKVRFSLSIINAGLTGAFFIPVLLLLILHIRNIIYNRGIKKKNKKVNEDLGMTGLTRLIGNSNDESH